MGALIRDRCSTFLAAVGLGSEGVPAPTPSVTIELVHARTGEVQSVQVFPGYTGTVRFTSSDPN